MSWNGHVVVDMDSHVYEEADQSYQGYVDPAFQEPYGRLCEAIAQQRAAGLPYSLFMSRNAILETSDEGRPLGMQDTFGLVPERRQSGAEERVPARDRVRREVNWEPRPRLEDMDRAGVDIGVIFPTHASSYCVLRDVMFESALYRAYHRFIANFCAGGGGRLRWVALPNLRDVSTAVAEVTDWAERDPNLVGIYLTPVCPNGRLLDNPDLHPLFQRAQDLDLPMLVHPGVMRSPLTPGALELDNAGFLIRSVYNPWAGQTALSALIGGGVFDLFPKLRIATMETSGGWLPFVLAQLDERYEASAHLAPNLKRLPHEIIEEGRYFHALEVSEKYVEHCVHELGEDLWIFSTDYPHTGSPWPNGVSHIIDRKALSNSTVRKILGANAMRLCSRLASWSPVAGLGSRFKSRPHRRPE